MSQLSVKEHLDGILSDFEALKRSFDVEDAEEELAFHAARSPLSPSTPGVLRAPGHAEGSRGGGPILPAYQSRISMPSSSSPSHSPVLKARIGGSLSFNRGTTDSPRANGTHLARVSSFQTRPNPNGYPSSLGPGSDDSLHSSSSSLECPTPVKGAPNPPGPSESAGKATPELLSSVLKKFSSYGSVFSADGGRPKASFNHSSMPSLDLHIAEDQGLAFPLGSHPPIPWGFGGQDRASPLPMQATSATKEALGTPSEGRPWATTTAPGPAPKLQKFPLSLEGLMGKSPESAVPPETTGPPSSAFSGRQLQVDPSPGLGHAQPRPDMSTEDQTGCPEDDPPMPTSRSSPRGEEGPASPPEDAAPGLGPPPPLAPMTPQPSCLGQRATVTPPETSAAAALKASAHVVAERTGAVSQQESSASHTLVSPSCPGEDPPRGVERSLPSAGEEKDDARNRAWSKEEHRPERQPLSMEEQMAAQEPLSRDTPARGPGDRELFGYVGIEAVLDQMRIKTMKCGFEFNILVVGQSGLGKSTMVNTLFKSMVSRKSSCPGYEERIPKTVQLKSVNHVIEEKGVKMKLTVTDTPGFGDQINNQNCWEPIVEYINDQYECYLREELLINRKRIIPDSRVHACVYFVPPTGHWLRPLDLEFMRRLSKITNVVPVIAKADTLTLEERTEFRQRVQKDLRAHGIQVYPQVDFDEDPDERLLNDKIREKIPFAVVGADKEHQVNGKKVLGRKTKWGIIEVENPAHSEFPLLRDLLIRSNLQDLKDITHNVHYEQYRVRRLNDSHHPAKTAEQLVLSSVNGEPESHL